MRKPLTTNRIPGRTALIAAGVCGATANYVYLPLISYGIVLADCCMFWSRRAPVIWAHVCSLSWTQLDPWHVVNMNELNAVAVMEHGRREGRRSTCTANGTEWMLRLVNAWS